MTYLQRLEATQRGMSSLSKAHQDKECLTD